MRSKIHYPVLVLVLCLTSAACSLFPNYGRINPSQDVARSFETYQVNPEFRYYISGPDLNPNALMGLQRQYRLDPATLWREVYDMTPAKMKEFVDGMNVKVSARLLSLHGFELLDPKGRRIGIWYSLLNAETFLRINDDGTVRIDTPALDTYERAQGDDPPDPLILKRPLDY